MLEQVLPAIDNPERWNQRSRPSFDARAYQKRIDRIVGLNNGGKSIIRIVWAQDVRQRFFNEETPTYWTKRQRKGAGYVYWQPPRWILEKRLEPEQYVDAWEKTRWAVTDPETGKPVDKGPAPSEFYTFAYLCAQHEHADACCERAYYTDRSRCWGRYREPNEDDLQLIAQAVARMNADKYRDPYRPMTLSEMEEVLVNANMQADRAAEEFAQYEEAMMHDFNKLHGWRIFEHSPKTLHHGKVHDVGASFQRQESGLYLPE